MLCKPSKDSHNRTVDRGAQQARDLIMKLTFARSRPGRSRRTAVTRVPQIDDLLVKADRRPR